MNELMEINIAPSQAPAIYGHNKLSAYVDNARAAVAGEVPDLTTRKGRERIASLAAMVSKSKVAVEKPGRDYLKQLKAKVKPIEEELRTFVTEMDALRDQIRRPLTEYEAAEAARLELYRGKLRRFETLAIAAGLTADEYRALIAEVEADMPSDDWGDYQLEGERLREIALNHLTASLESRIQFDADQAELTKLREEAEARRKQEAAEQATREAEARGRQEAQAAIEAAERARTEAIERAKRAEQEAAEREAQAAERERQRIAAEQAQQAEEQAKREANRQHCAEINRAIVSSFVAESNITEEQAKLLVMAIARGLINNVRISY